MFTRRSVLASPLAWTVACWAERLGIRPALAAPQRVRFNVTNSDGQTMLKTYAAGVKALKAASGRLPQSWTFQWYIHASPNSQTTSTADDIRRVFGRSRGPNRTLAASTWSTCQAHMGSENELFFLPWHRLYLGYFEALIRTVTATPDFTLPYWDYTDPRSAALPEQFQDRFADDPVFGVLHMRNRNKDDGQFAGVNAGAPLNKHLRGAENFLNLDVMSARAYAGVTGFNQRLDEHLHGNVHTYVGDDSNMANIPTAAGDPIFWLHHCNIDRIWYAWDKAGGRNPTDAAWLNKSFTFVDGSGKRARAAVKSIVDLNALPYRYDALPGPAVSPALVARARAVPVVVGSAAPAPAPAPAQTGEAAAPAPPPPPPAPAPSTAAGPSTEAAQASPPPVPSQPLSAPPPSETTARAQAPIPLGAEPKTVTLAPNRPEMHLRTMAPMVGAAAPNPNARLFLLLNGVQAKASPGTVYKVYIDLPADASPEVAEQHFVGLLNFFDKVVSAAHAAHGAAGKSVAFDITEVTKTLHLQNALAENTSVTLIPTGKPNAAALPVIKDGIEIRRE